MKTPPMKDDPAHNWQAANGGARALGKHAGFQGDPGPTHATPPAPLSDLSPTSAALLAAYPPGIHPDLARALALHGVSAEQISFHASDVHVSCSSRGLAATLRDAGPWRSMADVYATNPEHPDAARWPYGLDVPFAALSRFMAAKAGQS